MFSTDLHAYVLSVPRLAQVPWLAVPALYPTIEAPQSAQVVPSSVTLNSQQEEQRMQPPGTALVFLSLLFLFLFLLLLWGFGRCRLLF